MAHHLVVHGLSGQHQFVSNAVCLDQMRAEGTVFTCNASVTADQLRGQFDAVVLAGGARVPRELPVQVR